MKKFWLFNVVASVAMMAFMVGLAKYPKTDAASLVSLFALLFLGTLFYSTPAYLLYRYAFKRGAKHAKFAGSDAVDKV